MLTLKKGNNMDKIITAENIRSFAYVNDAVCLLPIKGVALSFFGLGNMTMYDGDTAEGVSLGKNGILYVVPYTNPWAWMNAQTVALVDEILDVLFDKFSLPDSTPIVSSGESMGGQSALTYCAYAKRTPVACVANCPVCDALYHYSERADLPRTMYSALHNFDGTLECALKSISPIHLAERLPKIRYFIFHCDADSAVNISVHSDLFVKKMREVGHSVDYTVVKGRDHCDIGKENRILFEKLIADSVLSARK